MLVLTRRPQESIVIPGSNIVIQVLGVQGGRVKIGIQAPADVEIRRPEARAPKPAARPNLRERVAVGAH